MANTVLITGATGKQGGAVIDALLSAPNSTISEIYALTRNPESGGAKALAKKSTLIKLVKGDLNDCDAVFETAGVPIKGVFCVSIPAMGFGAKADAEEVSLSFF
jgi:uncharacterized protein YbjT (DUF2867 family)